MWGPLAGGIVGGLISSIVASALDGALEYGAFFGGVIISSLLSGLEDRALRRAVGLAAWYATAAAGFLLHTAIFGSWAALGILAVILYTPIVVPFHLAVSWVVGRLLRRTGRGASGRVRRRRRPAARRPY